MEQLLKYCTITVKYFPQLQLLIYTHRLIFHMHECMINLLSMIHCHGLNQPTQYEVVSSSLTS